MYLGYTGRLFEAEILGTSVVAWEWDGTSYVTFRRAMEMARRRSDWNPTDPPYRRANDLHALIAESLGVDYQELAMYNALGSPLDRFHGIDLWFEFRGRVLTIDLTVNGQKDIYRADMILRPENCEDLPALATVIARDLKGGGR